MPETQNVDQQLAREANDRYWSSEASVNQIAEAMGLSKSSLYGLIEELETGLACPECTTELVFPNRTARDRGQVSCPGCDFEGSAEDVMEAVEPGATRPVVPDAPTAGAPGALAPGTRALAGTALLGVAAGLILGSVFRKR